MSLFDTFLATSFTIACALILYHHLGYPLLLKLIASRAEPAEPGSSLALYKRRRKDCELPTITFVVPAYNEQEWIADKIRNIATLDYPKQKLMVKILCDGCTDQTAEIARATIQEAICADTLFEVTEYPQNRGKVAVINQAMADVDGELTVLSDVTALVSIDALLIAASHFVSPEIGVVNGTYTLFEAGSLGEQKYWEYQSRIKAAEASLATSIGSHGAFYIFRTRLFEPLRPDSINDDFILPMIIVKQGYLADYDTNVIATEMQPTSLEGDFARRLRISAGNMQQIITLFALFHPRFKGVAFAFFSGKGLRMLTPYLMLTALVTSGLLLQYPLFQLAFIVQSTLYLLGLFCWLFPELTQLKPFHLIYYLLRGHTANLYGGLQHLFTRVTR